VVDELLGMKVVVTPHLPMVDERRPWCERLFTRPWRPWRTTKKVPNPNVYILSSGRCNHQ
jgi:hypothetical protein